MSKPSIEDVYEHYGLRIVGADRGSWRKAQCPLPGHLDDNPSATVDTDENKFHCHACDVSGDSYDIVKEREGVTRWPDIKRLTESIAKSGDGPVREQRGGSSLLPRRSGNRGERGAWSPPWTSL